ncbi:hypothetical protein LSH36_34g03012 [Paralvinella palmiformis]|uniref:Hepatocyte growth factor-regulated tyrosine kinase substrate n=1 Tax=Paralvinella palmiformis TaxID=53620 RepID=A0AAD9NEB6_9ANNE|nr:hypothetical protein LSH36_34g03012 [Paralvinella palmiformis]
MFATSAFTRLIEKSTSHLNLEPDWDSTLQICDSIRQRDIQAKFAIQSLKKKISQDNPHVSVFALGVLESCVKNCGSVIHEEIATKEFMEFLKDQAKIRPDPVRAKILELVQVWSHAFRNEPNYKVVQDTFHLMKMEGYTFPTLKEADAMFKAESAPDWADGECCHRCRVTFSTFLRKHHCRHCGNVFCNKCSSKTSIIPKFGIEKEVRVCESCYEDINGPSNSKKEDDGLPSEYLNSPLSKQPQNPPAKTEQEIKEEEDLQLAIALSKNHVKSKHTNKTNTSNSTVYSQPTVSNS